MGLYDRYEYKPGLTFGSKASSHIEMIRPKVEVLAQSGIVIDVIPELVAEFATHNGEYAFTSADGDGIAADIRGHFFDLDQAAEAGEWSDDDRELAAKKLLYACDKFPGHIWLHSKTPAAKPWPTFDTTPHGKVGELAETLGLVVEAQNYELENKARKSVLADLANRLVAAPAEVDEESLTAA